MRVPSNFRELEESREDWERYQRYSLQDIKNDRDKRNMVLHAMLVSIQSAIDIASHLISLNGLRRPALMVSHALRRAFRSLTCTKGSN
jgi:uncharacterized protein YutE (UPF0331/DUF86 family)